MFTGWMGAGSRITNIHRKQYVLGLFGINSSRGAVYSAWAVEPHWQNRRTILHRVVVPPTLFDWQVIRLRPDTLWWHTTDLLFQTNKTTVLQDRETLTCLIFPRIRSWSCFISFVFMSLSHFFLLTHTQTSPPLFIIAVADTLYLMSYTWCVVKLFNFHFLFSLKR